MQFANKCVCEICRCGGHRCPVHKTAPFQGTTAHKQDYIKHPLPQKYSRVLKAPQKSSYDPQSLTTSYKNDYPKKNIPKQSEQLALTQSSKKPKLAPFQGVSSYKQEFKEKPIQKKQQRAMPFKPSQSKFEGQSTYKDHFDKKQKQPQTKNDFTSSGLSNRNKPGPKFQGTSSYKDQFIPKQLPKEKFKRQMPVPSSTPMQVTSTHYKDPHPIEKKEACPIYELPHRPARLSPGKDHLVFDGKNWD